MACAFSLNDVTLFYSEKELLTHVNLTLSDDDRIGVVGRNGAGKSTLLRLLAGLEEPDKGDLTRRRGMTVAYLPQTPELPMEETITDAALSYLPARLGEDPSAAAYEAQTLLTQLGFTDLHAPVSTLSGGQRMRVALAGVLCRESDVLLLDEPTNHIDLEMAQWLEQHLLSRKGTLVVVTHDRYLLQRVFDRILHVGGGKVDSYQCTYADYLEERAQREEMEAATLRKAKSLYRKELAWIRAGAPARSTKQKGRIQRFGALEEAVRETPSEETVSMKSVASRLGRKIMTWEHLDVTIGGKALVRDFTYALLRDDRLGIVGSNGAGKTTLLRTLVGELPPGGGTLETGDTVKIGYFAQHCPPLDPDTRIIDAVRDVAVRVYTPDGDLSASQMAETFLFPPAMQYQKVASLSGGEQRRLYLLRILMSAPNVLVLDEPTNDLDLETLNVLEDYLDSFQGAVIAVSHDRYFLDRVTRLLFAMQEERMVPYIGGYQSYLDALNEGRDGVGKTGANAADKSGAKLAGKSADNFSDKPAGKSTAEKRRASDRDATRFTFREQRDFDTIDATIANQEALLTRLAADLEASASDYGKVTTLMAQQEEAQQHLDALMERWMYLQEKWERIQQTKKG